MKYITHHNKKYYVDSILSYSFQEPCDCWIVWLNTVSGNKVELECDSYEDWKILLCKLGEALN